MSSPQLSIESRATKNAASSPVTFMFLIHVKCRGHSNLTSFKDPPEPGLFCHKTSSSVFRHFGILEVEVERPYKSVFLDTQHYTPMAFTPCPLIPTI